ncbi:MAG: hypothetical protein AMXMBFR45_01360 [Gammaproteobacteria bacterium]|nr:MAG: DUF924 domain-containing protein [Pseudomonadota bacterium]MBC6945433.1 DUF924 domain-containing protein [Gammaproteobacteria bacterium]MCE7895728.1 DUF924 domain-containing protein [Gammaproteobacteria bacterium PRO8]MDL1881120.1 DUF924 domain-containing protein [Gammaproteobacteria bacterium PRO2]MCL4776817.1 DUF924 family protein [Gammaproteobacteria bacterium]
MQDEAIRRILDFWFSAAELDAPQIDSRMERWFGSDPALDQQIRTEFGPLVERALAGELDGWATSAEGRLALILLLDQFCRNIHRGSAMAFAGDRRALKLCIEGSMGNEYRTLSPVQRVFFFMPLQHAESAGVQDKSVRIYNALAEGVSDTLRETFLTFAQFAELHRDIVARFGRFPHRNRVLGRSNTPEEDSYLAADAPSFGQ